MAGITNIFVFQNIKVTRDIKIELNIEIMNSGKPSLLCNFKEEINNTNAVPKSIRAKIYEEIPILT